MQVITTEISGVKIIEPRVFHDSRGYFFESFAEGDFRREVAPGIRFVQDNESRSTRGVVRGLHFQRPPFTQAKLVRCTLGRVLDVAVDLRKGSATYGQYVAVELSDENKRQLFIPRGFAHGFSVLSDEAVFQYKCDNYYSPESEDGIDLFDADLAVDWRTKPEEAILSAKDLNRQSFKDFDSPFVYEEI